MFVLGIDPGLSATGYGVIEVNGPRLMPVAAGVIRTDRGAATAQRLAELAADLETVISDYNPSEAAIEEVFVNRNLQTATGVGRAAGAALLTVARAGLEVAEYTPSAVKLAVSGSGTATKEQVQAMVARRLGLEAAPSPADAADALAVAICHAQAHSGRRRVAEARS